MPPQDVEYSDWRTYDGRDYRYVDIDGESYIQYDDDDGPLKRVADSSRPRTIPNSHIASNTRPSVGTRSSSNQSAYAPDARQSQSRPDARTTSAPDASYSYSTRPPESVSYASSPLEGYRHYSLFPRDEPEESNPSTLSSSGIGSQSHSTSADTRPLYRTDSQPRNVQISQGYVAQSRSAHSQPQMAVSSAIVVSVTSKSTSTAQQNYPRGTKKVIKKGDREYYYDKDGKLLASSGRQGIAQQGDEPLSAYSNPARRGNTVDDMTDRLTALYTSTSRESGPYGDPRSSEDRLGQTPQSRRDPGLESRSTNRVLLQSYQSDARENFRDRQIDAEDPRSQSLRSTAELGSTQRSTVAGNTRRSSMSQTQRPALQSISELAPLIPGTKIVGDGRTAEKLDSRYIVRKGKEAEKFFVDGRVFALLWHESYGNEGTELSEANVRTVKFGEKIYSTIRRMVIINARRGHCTCAPVATYGERGTLKPGLTPGEVAAHAVIHMVGTSGDHLREEAGIVKKPITVKPATPDQRLHPMSRINLDKIYTIEYNVKVMNVGRVIEESRPHLSLYYMNTHFPRTTNLGQ